MPPDSAARLWAPLARLSAREAGLGEWAQARGKAAAGLYEFVRFGHQAAGWAAVSPQKFGSWFLLMIISYTLVALVSRPRIFAEAKTVAGPEIDVAPGRPSSRRAGPEAGRAPSGPSPAAYSLAVPSTAACPTE
ncbi:hypothetical protein [Methylobacterium indicum]|uniref:hypothetical protein n=1 Tax=Methylobacterium indicum TaxID=1775910 RepID=UPI003C6D882D